MNEASIMELFGRYGPLASVKIMYPRSEEEKSRGTNCGFVAYMSRKDAERAMHELNGSQLDSISVRMSWGRGNFLDDTNPQTRLSLSSCSCSTTTGVYSTDLTRIDYATTAIRSTIQRATDCQVSCIEIARHGRSRERIREGKLPSGQSTSSSILRCSCWNTPPFE